MSGVNEITDAALDSALSGGKTLRIQTQSADETRSLAGRLARLIIGQKQAAPQIGKGEIIALIGDLGTGKTTFVQGFCAALGVQQRVTSPTFTLMQIYAAGQIQIYHFDFYRLSSPDEIAALGCEEYFDSESISIVEWPELAWPFMSSAPLRIKIEMPDFVSHPERRNFEIKRMALE